MNALDLFCLMVLLSFGILGVRRGFLHTAVTLVGWALSGFFLGRSYPTLEAQLQFLEFTPVMTSWIASAVCALFVLWFFYFLSEWIRDFAHAYGFLEADKILGFLLGTGGGWISCAFILPIFKEFTGAEESRLWKTSRIVKLCEQWESTQEPRILSSIRKNLLLKSTALKESEDLLQPLRFEKKSHSRTAREEGVKSQSPNVGSDLKEPTLEAPVPERKKFSKRSR